MTVSGQLQAPAALLPGKERLHPLNRGPGRPQVLSGHREEEINLTLAGS
jgi:hypothetical protein